MNEFNVILETLHMPKKVRLYQLEFKLKDYYIAVRMDDDYIVTPDYLSIYVPSGKRHQISPDRVAVLNKCRKEKQLNNLTEVGILYKYAKALKLIDVGKDDIEELTLFDTMKAFNIPRHSNYENKWSIYNPKKFPSIKLMVMNAYNSKYH